MNCTDFGLEIVTRTVRFPVPTSLTTMAMSSPMYNGSPTLSVRTSMILLSNNLSVLLSFSATNFGESLLYQST